MTRPLHRTALIAVAGLLAAASPIVATASAATPQTGGSVVTTQFDVSSPSLHLVSGSDLGVTWTAGAYPAAVAGGYRLLGQPAHVSVGRAAVVLAGHTRYVDQGIPYASSDTWTGEDLDTGQSFTALTVSNATALAALLPHGALFTTDSFMGDRGQLMLSRSGGPAVPVDTGTIPSSSLPAAAGDDSGAVISWRDPAGTAHTGYVDFSVPAPAGGYPVTALPPAAMPSWQAPGQLLALSPRSVAYERADGVVVRYDRATLAAGSGQGAPAVQTAQPTTGTVTAVATTDTGLGWETAGTPNRVTTCAEPAGGCATVAEATVLPARTDQPPVLAGVPNQAAYVPASGLVAVGDDFALSTGVTRADRAVHLLDPGSALVGQDIDDTGPSAPYSVDLAPGRLLVDLGYQNYEQSLTVGPGGAVAGPVTAVSTVEPADNIRRAVSGSRTAVALGSGTTCTLQVDDGGIVVARWTGLPYAAGNLSFSGDRVLIPTASQSLMFSVGNPAAAPVKLPAQAVLFGDRLAYIDNYNEIKLRDLSPPGSSDTVIRPAGDNSQRVANLQLRGDWLYYGETDYHGSLFDTTSFGVADHLAAGGSVDRSLSLPAEADSVGGQALLQSGFVTVVGSDLAVHLIDLSDGSDEIIGRSAVPAGNGFTLGSSDDAVVWVGDDLRVHILPVRTAAQTGPQLLGTESLPPATTPITVAVKGLTAHLRLGRPAVRRTYLARIDSGRPLTSWTFTLRDSKGRVILRRTGRAPRGSVSVSWNGTYRGKPAVGKATWTLTGKGPGGALTGRDGRTKFARGTFTVARARKARQAHASPVLS